MSRTSRRRPRKTISEKTTPADAAVGASQLTRDPPGLLEITVAAIIVIAAAAARLAAWDHLAVEHFDEGVYASNLWFDIEQNGQYPMRQLYAPPLVPLLIEFSLLIFGPSAWAPILPSLFFGTATVALIWWVGRTWFGPRAGLSAAALAALSDFHILYSRTALTDVVLGFFVLLAVYAFVEALACLATARDADQPPSSPLPWGWLTLAGVATALAWSSKYNGWLPLAVGLAGGLLWSLLTPQGRMLRLLDLLQAWTPIAAIAVVCWLPTYFSLPNGYAEVAANHRQYVQPFDSWLSNLSQQWIFQRAFESPASFIGLAAAMSLILLSPGGGRGAKAWVAFAKTIAIVCAAIILAMVIGVTTLLFLAFWFGIGALLLAALRVGEQPRWALSCCSLAAWVGGLSLALPLYTPYPRLATLLLIPLWLGGGAACAALLARASKTAPSQQRNQNAMANQLLPSTAVFALGAVISLAQFATVRDSTALKQRHGLAAFPPWQDRTPLRRAARRVQSAVAKDASGSVTPDNAFAIFVYAEPALFYHLRGSGIANVAPAASLEDALAFARRAPVPVYLTIGLHGRRTPGIEKELRLLPPEAAKPLATISYRPSDLVLSNHRPLWQRRQSGEPLTAAVDVYRLTP